jgi:hypothetical protein
MADTEAALLRWSSCYGIMLPTTRTRLVLSTYLLLPPLPAPLFHRFIASRRSTTTVDVALNRREAVERSAGLASGPCRESFKGGLD